MVAPAVDGIDLFKIAGRSISGWIPSFKMGSAAVPVKQPFCSQLEERLLLWLEYHPLVVSYARGDIGPQFAAIYRLPIPENAPFAIGYVFEGKPHDYLPMSSGPSRMERRSLPRREWRTTSAVIATLPKQKQPVGSHAFNGVPSGLGLSAH